MKRPISYLLVGIIVAALVIGAFGAAVSAVTSTGLQSTSTGGSGTDPTSTTTMTTTETHPSETTTATATMTSGQGSSGSTTGSGHQFFPFTGTPYPVPGKIEAENYDVGPCNQVGGGQGGSGTGTTTPTATATTTAPSTVTTTPTETTSGGGSSGNATTTPTTTATTTTTTSGEGGAGNQTPTATMTTAATTTTATTTATATATTTSGQGSSGQGSSGNVTGAANITILAPNATSTISGEMVTVMTRVSNFTLVDPATVNDTPAAGQGHIHYFLDAVPPTTPGVPARTGIAGEVLETPNTTIQWANITAGTHTFYAMLVNNDHTPYSPITTASVTFRVNATNASGMSGLGAGIVTTTTTATSGNGTPGQGSGNATSGMSIVLVAPNATSAIDGRLVNVATEVSNFTLVDPDMVNLTPAAGQGHIHYFLDVVPPMTPGVPADTGIGNTVFETPNTAIQWANVTPGMHTLYAMLVNNDHTPVIPIVVDSVSFQANQSNSTGMGTGTSNVTGTTVTTVTTGTMTGTPTINGTGTGNSSTIYGNGTGLAGAVVMAIINAITGSSGQDSYGTATGTMTASPTETMTVTPTATTTSGQGSSGQGSTGNQTIVQIAQADSNFSTLVTALQTAGLVETLNGTGPFTVFAPTNAAFDALPSGTLNALLANTTDLTRVLTYHVVSGNFPAAQVVSMTSLTTVEGQPLNVTVQAGGSVRVDGANITRTDIQASNGVIHVIDAVMIPPNATSGEGGSGTGTVTPTATATATATTTTTTTTSGQGTSGQGGAGQSTSGQPGAAPGQYGCGQGWAYFDRTPGNQGGVYRQDDVDIENGGTGHVVAFVKSSEWLIYSIHVPENGMYRATFSASSPWSDREIWVWVDGVLEAQVKVPNTGSFDTYQDTSADIALPVGNHYIRLEFVRDAQNLDFMTFERVGSIPTWPFFGAGTSSQGAGSSSGQMTTATTTKATTTHTTSTEGTSGQGSSGHGTATPTVTTTATMTPEEGSSGQETGTMTASPTETVSSQNTSRTGSSESYASGSNSSSS